jgi:peptide/nickel transport system substrate-binding protein
MPRSRLRSYHLLALALVVAAAACGRRTRPPADRLVFVVDTVMATADPRFCMNNHETKLSRLVAPGLTTIDNDALEPRPMLAESWQRIDDVTWDFTLAPGHRFSDGQPVTADDVAWTYTSVIAEGSPSVSARQFRERFTRIEALDARTVRFHLVKPLATLLGDLDFGILSKRSARPDGSFPGGRAVGAGPYRVVEIDPRRVVIEKSPHYAGTPAIMPTIELRVVRDAGARNLMLVGGSADVAQNNVRLDLIDDVVKRGKLAVISGKSTILSYLMMNNEDPVLKDVRVRRAIALALDRPALVAAKFSGRATLATGLLPPGHWAYEADVERWDRDLDRARALLDEAGLVDPDGSGPRPRANFVYKTSSDQFRVAVARVIAAQLGDVGLAVEVRAFEFGTFFADIKQGSFQLASMQTAEITEPDFYFAYFSSTRIPTPQNPNANNRWRYRNARVDELVEAGRRELDQDRRRAIYSEVQKIVASEVPIVPLWHEDNVVLAHPEVAGYTLYPDARYIGLATVHKPMPAPAGSAAP